METYTATSLEDIAEMFERLATMEDDGAKVAGSIKEMRQHKGAAYAYRDAAKILRRTRIKTVNPSLDEALNTGDGSYRP